MSRIHYEMGSVDTIPELFRHNIEITPKERREFSTLNDFWGKTMGAQQEQVMFNV